MGLFARDEKDWKLDEFTPEAAAAETKQPPPKLPTPLERTSGRDREMTAHLGKGSRISGKLTFEGPARIDGEMDGEICAKDTLLVEESAVVTAQIVGSTVIIKGKVTGNVQASERIEIRSPGRLEGDVVAPTLVIHEGARFDGRSTMSGAESPSEARKTPAVSVKRS